MAKETLSQEEAMYKSWRDHQERADALEGKIPSAMPAEVVQFAQEIEGRRTAIRGLERQAVEHIASTQDHSTDLMSA